MVVNCAFLTREKVRDLGPDAYGALNRELTERFVRTIELPSVGSVVTISSGAAWTPDGGSPDPAVNLYGHLKWHEEVSTESAATKAGKHAVICRAWSVSGPYVGRPRDYAFSDIVAQALVGDVTLSARHLVWRRYVDVADLLAVAVGHALGGRSGMFDSGGELVELGELAELAISILRPGARVHRETASGDADDHYHSDNASWESRCAALGRVPLPLREQIRLTADALKRVG